MSDQALLEDISRSFPELELRSWRALGEGWMNRALLVNETHVFRFAKDADAAQDLAKEGALLPLIAERTTLSVPRFERVGHQSNGLTFVGYPIIAGDQLSPASFEALTPDEQQQLAEQLSQLLGALQSVPGDACARAGLQPVDYRREYAKDRLALQELHGRLQPTTRDFVERRFDEFLARSSYFELTPRLIHADLSSDHLIFDDVRRELIGVIDFGDLELGDPDYEYLYLVEELGPAFARRVMTLRGVTDPDATLEKVGYYLTFDHVHLILGGLKRGLEAWVADGIAGLDAEAKQPQRVQQIALE